MNRTTAKRAASNPPELFTNTRKEAGGHEQSTFAITPIPVRSTPNRAATTGSDLPELFTNTRKEAVETVNGTATIGSGQTRPGRAGYSAGSRPQGGF